LIGCPNGRAGFLVPYLLYTLFKKTQEGRAGDLDKFFALSERVRCGQNDEKQQIKTVLTKYVKKCKMTVWKNLVPTSCFFIEKPLRALAFSLRRRWREAPDEVF